MGQTTEVEETKQAEEGAEAVQDEPEAEVGDAADSEGDGAGA